MSEFNSSEVKTGPIEFSIYQPMISSQADLQGRKYHLFTGKSGRRWLVADQKAAAENVYVEGKKGSDGFGGATLTFELVTGGELKLTGPWKVGADGLFEDTGHDVRDTHYTRGIIALRKEYQKWGSPALFYDVLHYDEEPVFGSYDRIKNMAKAFANELGVKVFTAMIAKGGGSSGWEEPATAVAKAIQS